MISSCFEHYKIGLIRFWIRKGNSFHHSLRRFGDYERTKLAILFVTLDAYIALTDAGDPSAAANLIKTNDCMKRKTTFGLALVLDGQST